MSTSNHRERTTLTITQAAEHLISELRPAEREQLRTSTLPAFAYHRGLGMYIRNKYIYSRRFKIDTESEPALWHPDSLSNAVVGEVLQLLRGE